MGITFCKSIFHISYILYIHLVYLTCTSYIQHIQGVGHAYLFLVVAVGLEGGGEEGLGAHAKCTL